MQTYTTKQIADAVGIHVNTVRFYEEIGFLTKPDRLENGHRVFTELHLAQCRLIRRAMKAEVLQNGLRKKAVEVVRLCAALDFDACRLAAEEYCSMIDAEIQNAKVAIRSVENILNKNPIPEGLVMRRRDAAKALNVTYETLRTWERRGFIQVKRSENGYRVYDATDMERFHIIRTLRLANYSLSAILRLFNQLDMHKIQSVEAILNTPDEGEDIISVCDRLILSLQGTAADAKILLQMIEKMKEIFHAIQ